MLSLVTVVPSLPPTPDPRKWVVNIQRMIYAGVVGVVVNSLTLHRGDLGSIPGFGIQVVQIHA